MGKRTAGSVWLILALWAIITGLDLNKAFHIDDPFHLMMGQWIGQHPFTPMSGVVDWGHGPQVIHEGNQPPGFMYLVALTGHLFGYHEVPMHLMRSLFTLLALVCFHRLARHLHGQHAGWLTALFAFCPAFMVNQGVMTDTPLLAMMLLFLNLLLVPGKIPKARRTLLAGLVLSGALFIKYAALPILVVFPLALVLQGERKLLPLAAVPVLWLVIWSGLNVLEFGQVQLLERTGGDPSARGIFVRTLGLFSALGSVAPFTLLFLPGRAQRRPGWLLPLWLVAIAGALGFGWAVYTGRIGEAASDQMLRITFTLNGLLFLFLAVRLLPQRMAPNTATPWILAAWVAGLALFFCLFAPFMATRHVLLLVPALLLMAAPALDAVPAVPKFLAVACTAALGVALTLSDKAYADFFRREAPLVAAESRGLTTGTVYSAGNWGWHWYIGKTGIPAFIPFHTVLEPGDVLVMPENHDAPPDSLYTLEPLRSWGEPPGQACFFQVDDFASLYASSYGKLPWQLGRQGHKRITAYRVVEAKDPGRNLPQGTWVIPP